MVLMATIGRNPQKTSNEIRAAESGSQAVGQAAGQLNQAYEHGQDNALKAASIFGQQAQQGVENKQRQQQLDEQGRSNRMQEALEEDKTSMQGAAHGVEAQGPTRAQQVRQEMERGRLQTQMDKPLEIVGPEKGTYAKTEAQKAIDEEESFSKRLNAQANFLRASESYNDAKLKGDVEAAKRERESLIQPIKSGAKLFKDAKDGKLSDGQWDNLAKAAADRGDAEMAKEAQTKILGPRTSEHIQRMIDYDSLKFMAATGDEPDGELVDPASTTRQHFNVVANGMQSFLKGVDGITGGMMSAVFGIDSLAKRNSTIRRLAAEAMLTIMANPGATPPGTLPTPSSGRPQNGQSGPTGKPVVYDPAGGIQGGDAGPGSARPGDPKEAELQRQIEERSGRGESAYERRKRAGDYGLGGGGKR